MTDPVRLDHLNDPDVPARLSDVFGEPMGAVYTTDLDDWAWLIEQLDGWLTNASASVRDDYAAFVTDRFGPGGGPALPDVCWMLGAMSLRMRVLASARNDS